MQLVYDYIMDPTNPAINRVLATNYLEKGQLASATTHFLKAADNYTSEREIAEMLYKTAECFQLAGGREETYITLLKRVVSLDSKHVDAYIKLCEYYERNRMWQDCYMMANLAVAITRDHRAYFFKGVAAWWVGNTEEAREVMYWLWSELPELEANYQSMVLQNVSRIGFPQNYTRYDKAMHKALKLKFNGSETIENNYSQCYQDMFALYVAKGKLDGYYLELGSADPIRNNNTYLLEQLGWKGISIDIDFASMQKFRRDRKNIGINANGLGLDYKALLDEQGAPKVIDYLQIDCDPPNISFEILKKMPFDDYIFNAITFEHDFYADPSFRDQSREFLISKGYELAASDVAFMEGKSFEDWWIHKSVNMPYAARDGTKTIKTARNYMFDSEVLKNNS